MSDRKESQSSLFKSLLGKQREHETLLDKVEKTSARLEQRKAKFLALESDITDLELRLSEPRKARAGRPNARDGALKHARLIFNPSAECDDESNATDLARIVSRLRAHGIEAHVSVKASGDSAREIARSAVSSGEALIVVAGGDGTIGEVASQLVGSSTVLAIVPMGTTNNLARSLGVPLGIDDACALIAKGATRSIDVGRVVANGGPEAEYFVDCAGVGLSAIANLTGPAFQKHHWRAVPRALRKFFEARLGTVVVEMDNNVVDASTRMVTVSNAPFMGNKMLVVPGAKMDDGLLDVQIYDGMRNATLLKYFTSASSRSPEALKTYRVRRIRITAEGPAVPNSETRERHVIDVDVVPKALSVIVGNGIGLTGPVEFASGALGFEATDEREQVS